MGRDLSKNLHFVTEDGKDDDDNKKSRILNSGIPLEARVINKNQQQQQQKKKIMVVQY